MIRFGFLFSLFILLSSGVAQASALDARNCVATHVRDAMKLNTERKPLYQLHSENRSTEVTDQLLKMERKLLLGAPFADAWARLYQRKGIPIMCEDFIDMSETPAFVANHPEGMISILHYRKPDALAVTKNFQSLYKVRAYVEMAHYADNLIIQLEAQPRYNCLYRHMLESIRRMAILTPQYMEMANEQSLPSTELLSRTVLKSNISLLEDSASIDQLAAPLQARGLPIICQDVPFIPWP